VQLRPWYLTLVLVVFCAAVVGGLLYWRTRPALGVSDQLRYVPAGDGATLFLDIAVLRRAGVLAVLAGNKAAEDEDYRKFVQGTGFDYREDLDTVLAAWRGENLHILVTGRFDWERLTRYAMETRGRCHRTVCTVFATDPDKYISFTPLRTGVLGISIAGDPMAAAGLAQRQAPPPFEVPSDPVWAVLPKALLVPRAGFPAALTAFLNSLSGVNRATVTLGGTVAQLEFRLRGECADPKQARAIAARLEESTQLLKDLLAKESKPPSADDLSSVITAGVFLSDENRLIGRWPISRGFLESLAGGEVR
jgi:hypothetical protein